MFISSDESRALGMGSVFGDLRWGFIDYKPRLKISVLVDVMSNTSDIEL